MEDKLQERISSFSNSFEKMIAKNTKYSRHYFFSERVRSYSEEEIEKIIQSGSLEAKQALSRYYFDKDGFYTRLILYYATLLKYQGILIPNPTFGQKLSTPYIQKKYFNAVNFVEGIKIPILATNCAQKALVEGCYYGLIQVTEDGKVFVMDLPTAFCRTRFKDIAGNDIIEFNITYFDSIVDEDDKKLYLSAYPKEIQDAYKKYQKGKLKKFWIFLSTDITICFPFFLERGPFFLSVIPYVERYKDANDNEMLREAEEIRKIIVQHIPHMNDGRLVFEPPEAEEMHNGAVGMLKDNPNISVLTTYADVDSIVSKTTSDNEHDNISKMLQTIYNDSGTSSELFASTGSSTLDSSINNDMALMMVFANKFSDFVTNLVNKLYANSNINFKYSILPITYYNENKYIEMAFKTANSGYSLLLPAIAQGFSQKDFVNIKDLENDVLDLKSKLIPPDTSYTQSSNPVGAPKKEESEKAPKTLANEKSLDNQTEGGSD